MCNENDVYINNVEEILWKYGVFEVSVKTGELLFNMTMGTASGKGSPVFKAL